SIIVSTGSRNASCEYERASLPGAMYRPRLRTAPPPISSMTDMAQRDPYRDQRGTYKDPHSNGTPCHPDGPAVPTVLPCAPATPARETRLPAPALVGILTYRQFLIPRQPVKYRENRRQLGICCGELVGYATQGSLL